MELKTVIPNDCNVITNNLHPVFLFFLVLKLSKIKDFKVYFGVCGESITTYKLKLLITFIWLIKMEWFKASHTYINLENQFQIFGSWKSDFFELLMLPKLKKKQHIVQQLFNHVVRSYKNCCALKLFFDYMLCENFLKNFKWKNENSILNELPKISILPQNIIWSFRGV